LAAVRPSPQRPSPRSGKFRNGHRITTVRLQARSNGCVRRCCGRSFWLLWPAAPATLAVTRRIAPELNQRERGNFWRVSGELRKNRTGWWSELDLNFRDPPSLRRIFDYRAGSVMGTGLGIPRKPEVTVVISAWSIRHFIIERHAHVTGCWSARTQSESSSVERLRP
jgi:hypothetical protein